MRESKAYIKRAYKAEDWVNTEDAAKLLGIKTRSLGNLVCAGKIPDKFISKAVSGTRFFYKPGLIGLEN